jgi:uncharacterized protein (TIGR03118 family)
MQRNKLVTISFSMLAVAMSLLVIHSSPAQPIGFYSVTNLIGSSGAPIKDAHMVNAWGNAFFPANPFWINDEGTGVSELIDGNGAIFSALPLVTVPGAKGGKGQPTGIVANGTADFGIAGGPALFIFDTEDGTISAWNESSGTGAIIVVNNSGTAKYTGLALANNGTANQLYAANEGAGKNAPGSIDVFDTNFHPVTTPGGVLDAHLPAHFTPYNIQTLNGNLFVAYAKGAQAVGRVDEFDPNGNLIMTFTDKTLAAPWGLVVAPANFGAFSNDLLVGNLANGTISAFNLSNGEFVGQLGDTRSRKIVIQGLWSLVGGGALNTNPDAIYFTAGPKGFRAGVFGVIQVAPAPTPKPTRAPRPTRVPKAGKTPTATPTMVGDPTSPTATLTPSATPTIYIYPY